MKRWSVECWQINWSDEAFNASLLLLPTSAHSQIFEPSTQCWTLILFSSVFTYKKQNSPGLFSPPLFTRFKFLPRFSSPFSSHFTNISPFTSSHPFFNLSSMVTAPKYVQIVFGAHLLFFGSFGSFLIKPKEPKRSSFGIFRKNRNKSFCFV